ncbi:MAG: hypothetical protein ABW006_02560 [Hyphomicrobium sp.]
MLKADSVHSTPPTNTSATDIQSFAALSAAVSPMWHQVIVRLARTTQEASDKMDLLLEANGQDLRMRSRELVESLVNFLDIVDGNPDIEECDDDGEGEDAEPSFGSFDRMIDQSKSWRTPSVHAFPGADFEQDDCDAEDADPNADKQQPPTMGGEA